MSNLQKHILGQIGRELGASRSEVPARYRKIRVKGLPFRVSRMVAPRHCNIAVMEMNVLIMKLFTIVITPLGRKAPLVSLDIIRIPGKTQYICEVYESDGPEYASVYESIPCIGLKMKPVSDDLWYAQMRTFVKRFSRGLFQGDRELYERFIMEFIDRTCRIYREADFLGVPGDEARDCQIRRIQAYAHGLIENGGVSTEVFKAALGAERLADFYDTVLFRAVE